MASQTGKQLFAIHILSNIPRSKGNQMKFGQSIEYKTSNFFLKNNTQNVMKKLLLDPFQKNQIEHTSGTIV